MILSYDQTVGRLFLERMNWFSIRSSTANTLLYYTHYTSLLYMIIIIMNMRVFVSSYRRLSFCKWFRLKYEMIWYYITIHCWCDMRTTMFTLFWFFVISSWFSFENSPTNNNNDNNENPILSSDQIWVPVKRSFLQQHIRDSMISSLLLLLLWFHMFRYIEISTTSTHSLLEIFGQCACSRRTLNYSTHCHISYTYIFFLCGTKRKQVTISTPKTCDTLHWYEVAHTHTRRDR